MYVNKYVKGKNMSYFNGIGYQGGYGFGPRNLNNVMLNNINSMDALFGNSYSDMGFGDEFMMGGMNNQALGAMIMLIGLIMCMQSQYSGLDAMNYMNNWSQCCMPQQCMPPQQTQSCQASAQKQSVPVPQAQPQEKPGFIDRFGKATGQAVEGTVKGMGKVAKGVIMAPVTVAKGFFWDPAANVGKGLAEGVKHVAQGQIAEGIADVGGGIVKGAASPFVGIYKAGAGIGEGFIDGAKDFFKGQIDAFKTFWGW